jgi:hypothetical protein
MPISLILRKDISRPLTHTELDSNFTNLLESQNNTDNSLIDLESSINNIKDYNIFSSLPLILKDATSGAFSGQSLHHFDLSTLDVLFPAYVKFIVLELNGDGGILIDSIYFLKFSGGAWSISHNQSVFDNNQLDGGFTLYTDTVTNLQTLVFNCNDTLSFYISAELYQLDDSFEF